MLKGRSTLQTAKVLAECGIAVLWLKPRSKAPVLEKWTDAPRPSAEELERSYRQGYNIGVRLGEPSKTEVGYLHALDVDVNDDARAAEAEEAVRRAVPKGFLERALIIRSGSGGASRHIYFFSDKPFRKTTLARSEDHVTAFDKKKGREVKKRAWEVQLYGSGVQMVFPPSIHPETGNPYEVVQEIDFEDIIEWAEGPRIGSDVIAGWGAAADHDDLDDDDDDLTSMIDGQPLGLSITQAMDMIAKLPEHWVDDYEEWVRVGMALHHEFGGGEGALLAWLNWSKTSEKFENERELRQKWRGFGRLRGAPVRMASIKRAVAASQRGFEPEDYGEEGEEQQKANAESSSNKADVSVNCLSSWRSFPNLPEPVLEALEVVELPSDGRQWARRLTLNDKGKIDANLANAVLILRNDPRFRGVMAYSELAGRVKKRGTPKKRRLKKGDNALVQQLDSKIWKVRDPNNGDAWTDHLFNGIRVCLESPMSEGGYSLRLSIADLRAAIDVVGMQGSFHPVRDRLVTLEWDGHARLETVFIDYLQCPDTPYHRKTAWLWFTAGVARIFEPGHKFDFLPILRGGQGQGKSAFIRTLAMNPKHFMELEGDVSDTKQMMEMMSDAWILEIAELQAFSRSDQMSIKGFLSRTTDKARAAYAQYVDVKDRQCLFMGSTNEEAFLRDPTGARRFWPLEVGTPSIDICTLRSNIDQIWAEAMHRYVELRLSNPDLGEDLPLFLNDTATQKEALELQGRRQEYSWEDELFERICEFINTPIVDQLEGDGEAGELPDQITVFDVKKYVLDQERSTDMRLSRQIGKALNRLEDFECVGNRKRKDACGTWRPHKTWTRKES